MAIPFAVVGIYVQYQLEHENGESRFSNQGWYHKNSAVFFKSNEACAEDQSF